MVSFVVQFLIYLLFTGNEINPELLLAVFLPALLFESAFSMEVHQIKVSVFPLVSCCSQGRS